LRQAGNVLGERKGVLIRDMSSSQGCPKKGFHCVILTIYLPSCFYRH
jgi:hypothetical protein